MANQQPPPPNSNNIVNHNPIQSPPPSYINSGYENSYDHTSNWLPPTSQYSPNYPTPQGSNYNHNPPNSPPKYPSQYSPHYNQNPSNLPPDPSLYGPNYNPSPYNPNYPPNSSHRYEPASHFPVGNNSIHYPETAYPAGNHSMMDAPMSTPGHVENRPSTPPAPPETVKVKWRISRSDKKLIKNGIILGIVFILIGVSMIALPDSGHKHVVDDTAISTIGMGVFLCVGSVVIVFKSRNEARAAARQSQ